jgi:acetolactate synthase-1/3 small subunit
MSKCVAERPRAVVEVIVRNHPGALSHVCGLFARRGFNVDGVACLPLADRTRSRIWLLVAEDERLEQVTRHLAKLEDVIAVECRAEHAVFATLQAAVGSALQAPV